MAHKHHLVAALQLLFGSQSCFSPLRVPFPGVDVTSLAPTVYITDRKSGPSTRHVRRSRTRCSGPRSSRRTCARFQARTSDDPHDDRCLAHCTPTTVINSLFWERTGQIVYFCFCLCAWPFCLEGLCIWRASLFDGFLCLRPISATRTLDVFLYICARAILEIS